MNTNIVTSIYIFSGVLFILSLSGLSQQKSARMGNFYGMTGMILALVATAAFLPFSGVMASVAVMVLASLVGSGLAKRVAMTSMPELVAILHSFVGLSAVFVGVSSHLSQSDRLQGADAVIHSMEVYLGVWIGAVTFSGSLVAFGKLRAFISSKPLLIPARHFWNLAMALVSIVLMAMFILGGEFTPLNCLLLGTFLALIFGAHLVLAIGGADMPVVVSMLNSYSGWAASAAGFMLANDLLIITGALVGSSGAILSFIMCKAMNRSFISVILGGFGAESGQVASAAVSGGEVKEAKLGDVERLLAQASRVIIVPGYGLAVAQAQHTVSEITRILRQRKTDVRFAIHPVAGRLPGHMNVLLAEARVPYDIVFEMEEINAEFSETDVVLVVGANDTVNPGALEDPASPIAGMPVLEVWRSANVIVLKRGMAAGYSGAENPLFFKDNTWMFFGDAKKNLDALLNQLSQAS